MGQLSRSFRTFIAAVLLTFSSILMAIPIIALASNQVIIPITSRTMANKAKATAKDVEGKLESAYGELTDDKGHQLKGKAKQVEASAMKAAEDIKEAAKTVKKKLSDAANQEAEELS
jgi:uncharacterized protein YjbJ (UPF0337 family)